MNAILTFAVPTWNRRTQLEACIRSIASQVREGEAEIFVCDHDSTDGTWEKLLELCVEYPFIRKLRLARHEKSDFQDNFQFCFSQSITPWTWTFGDDDLLLPGSLELILNTLKRFDGEFIRVAEKVRASESPSYKRGTLLELCSTFGWLDMTGFITGNIVRTNRLLRAVNSKHWGEWSKNAFPQSCALIEELHDSKAMFIDLPLIDSQPKPPEDAQRWEANNTATRYFYVDEALRSMMDRGVLPKSLDNVFFRYHSYFLWDRLISNMISDYSTFPDKPQIHLWKHIEGLANLLADDQCMFLKKRILEVQEMIEKHQEAMEQLGETSIGLKILNDQHNTERFGWSYTGQPTGRDPADSPPAGKNGFDLMRWTAAKKQRDFDVDMLDKLGFGDQAKTLKSNRLAEFV